MLPGVFLFAILFVAQVHVDGVLGNIQQIGDLDHRVLDFENHVIIQTNHDHFFFILSRDG